MGVEVRRQDADIGGIASGNDKHRGAVAAGRRDPLEPPRPEDIERRGEGVGIGRARRDHRRRQHPFRRKPAAWVEDVPEPAPTVDEELGPRAARSQGRVDERHGGQPPPRPERMADADAPPAPSGKGRPLEPNRADTARAAMDEHTRHPGGGEHPDHSIERPPFADRSEVELEAGAREAHPPRDLVDLDMLHPRRRPSGGERRGIGGAPLAPQEAPGTDEAPGGRIEATGRPRLERAGVGEEGHEVRRDRLPPLGGGGVETGELARVAIDGDPVLDRVDKIERRQAELGCIEHLAGVEHHLEPARHRVAPHDERVELRKLRCRRWWGIRLGHG